MIQTVLRNLGYDLPRSFGRRRPDGIFGAETDAVVRSFQRDEGLVVDGIIGKKTLARLDEILMQNRHLDSACPAAYRGMVRARSVGRTETRWLYYT
jgi:peptidoglycan hydrolase-like protein with peptidoglycan-binding domain